MSKFHSNWIDRDEFSIPVEGNPSLLQTKERRVIVCLCGSTKFKQQYEEQSRLEGVKGKIVLTCSQFSHTDKHLLLTDQQKEEFDALHKDKIALADEIFIIDVNDYIGSSTRSEIDFALTLGKPIRYWSRENSLNLAREAYERMLAANCPECQSFATEPRLQIENDQNFEICYCCKCRHVERKYEEAKI